MRSEACSTFRNSTRKDKSSQPFWYIQARLFRPYLGAPVPPVAVAGSWARSGSGKGPTSVSQQGSCSTQPAAIKPTIPSSPEDVAFTNKDQLWRGEARGLRRAMAAISIWRPYCHGDHIATHKVKRWSPDRHDDHTAMATVLVWRPYCRGHHTAMATVMATVLPLRP